MGSREEEAAVRRLGRAHTDRKHLPEVDSEDGVQDLGPLPCHLYPDTPMDDWYISRDDTMVPCEAPAMTFALPCKELPMKLSAAVPVFNPVPLWQAMYTPQPSC